MYSCSQLCRDGGTGPGGFFFLDEVRELSRHNDRFHGLLIYDNLLTISIILQHQRRRQHFKSGQATANERSLVYVHGGGLQQAMCVKFTHSNDEIEQRRWFHRSTTTSKRQTNLNWLKRPVHNVLLSKRSFRKRERQGLMGSLCNRPTLRARLRSKTTASSGLCHIASSCTSYTHVYLATRGCRCSPGCTKFTQLHVVTS